MPASVGRIATCFLLGALAMPCVAPLVARTRERAAVAERTGPRPPAPTDTAAVRVIVRTTLHDALDAEAAALAPGARAELAWRLADVLRYRIDLARELRSGTAVSVLFLRAADPSGTPRVGDILAARLEGPAGRPPLEAIRYDGERAAGPYFDAEGRSLHGTFLRAPLAFRRISSRFGPRRHPILGGWREHRGVDYAAAAGTPVHAVADGTVAFAGSRHGYGNLVEVRHRSGIVTRYGHLRGFAPGITAGRRVRIGEPVGYVGMTGLATGPHLHFETLVHGVARDPDAALLAEDAVVIARAGRPAFDSTRALLLHALQRRTSRTSR